MEKVGKEEEITASFLRPLVIQKEWSRERSFAGYPVAGAEPIENRFVGGVREECNPDDAGEILGGEQRDVGLGEVERRGGVADEGLVDVEVEGVLGGGRVGVDGEECVDC